MQITVESLSTVKKKINVEVPAERVDIEIAKAYEQIRKKASIKGFRKGKVPLSFLEKHYSGAMAEDVLKSLVQDSYYKAVVEQKLFPVAAPVIESDDVKKGETFKFSATIEVMPEIEVKNHEGLEVKKERYAFDEAVVEKRLKDMQESMAQLKPVTGDRPAATGDFVVIDFEGFIDDLPFENGKGEDFQLELGSGQFIPGFEDQIVGMKTGEDGSISVKFPESYGAKELAGKDATFKIKVKEIKAKELPLLDDEFASQFGEFETMDEMRTKLKEIHEQQEQSRIESELKDRLLKELIGKNPCEVPDAMVDRQLEQMLETTKKRLASQKLTLEMMGLSEENYKERYRSAAEDQVKGFLLMESLVKQQGITVDDSDIEKKIEEIASLHNQDVAVVRKFYSQGNEAKETLSMQIKEDKALDMLLKSAKVSEVPKEEI
jgi:trigger factor